MAKYLIILGAALIVVGALLLIAGKTGWSGRLPGDILIKRENFTFYFPVTTSIILSVVLSLLLYLFFRK